MAGGRRVEQTHDNRELSDVPSVWELLGYGEVAGEVARSLEREGELVVISGPPGIGKS